MYLCREKKVSKMPNNIWQWQFHGMEVHQLQICRADFVEDITFLVRPKQLGASFFTICTTSKNIALPPKNIALDPMILEHLQKYCSTYKKYCTTSKNIASPPKNIGKKSFYDWLHYNYVLFSFVFIRPWFFEQLSYIFMQRKKTF